MTKEQQPPAEEKEQSAVDESNLTPWQKANLEYLSQKGANPAWNSDESKEADANTEAEEPKEQLPAEPIAAPDNTDEVQEEELIAKGPVNGSFADRLPTVKKIRNKRLIRRMCLLFLLFLIPALFALYYVLPISRLNHITVKGNESIATQDVLKNLDFETGGRLWQQYLVRDEHAAVLKEAEPKVKSAVISMNGLDGFTVQVKEYQIVAIYGEKNQYYPVLENGTVLQTPLSQKDANLPILENFSKKEYIKKVLTQYGKLSQALQKSISQIKYAPTTSNSQLLQLYMNDGNQVLVSISELKTKLAYYPQVVKEMNAKEMKGVVDMEAGIYSTPYPTEDSATDTSETKTPDSSTEND